MIALPLAFGSGYALVAFAVFYGLDWVATVPPTVAITADTFGRERVGVVFAWIFAAHQIGASAAAEAAACEPHVARDVRLRLRQRRGSSACWRPASRSGWRSPDGCAGSCPKRFPPSDLSR